MRDPNHRTERFSVNAPKASLFAYDPIKFTRARLFGWNVGHLMLIALPSVAASVQQPGQACTSIAQAAERLACYDLALRIEQPASSSEPARSAANDKKPDVSTTRESVTTDEPSILARVWELPKSEKSGTFRLLPHRANYLMPVNYSSRINDFPASPSADHTVPSKLTFDKTEAKFQLSFKVKAIESVFEDNGDLWLAFTQQSNWQMYNNGNSSPFRETNYEPEVIFSLRTDAEIFGLRWRLLNLGFVHQSNGRSLPLSRSWNRVYAQVGLERGPFTMLVRPWYRLPEGLDQDDNPDIHDYAGAGDVRLAYASGGHIWSVLGRYSGAGGRGGLQAEWAFPISGSLKGYVQVNNGYGANLVDYNHSQTTVGIGLLLLPWQ